jgi:hypothetical protein
MIVHMNVDRRGIMKSDFDTTVRLLAEAIKDLAKQQGVDAKKLARRELAKQKRDAVARGESATYCDEVAREVMMRL